MQCTNESSALVITGLDIRNRLEAACASQKHKDNGSLEIENEYDYIKYIQSINTNKVNHSQMSDKDDMIPEDDDLSTSDDLRMPSVYDGLSSDEDSYDKQSDNIDNTIKDMQNILTNSDETDENIWVKRRSRITSTNEQNSSQISKSSYLSNSNCSSTTIPDNPENSSSHISINSIPLTSPNSIPLASVDSTPHPPLNSTPHPAARTAHEHSQHPSAHHSAHHSSNPSSSPSPNASSNRGILDNPAFRDFTICGGKDLIESLSRSNGQERAIPQPRLTPSYPGRIDVLRSYSSDSQSDGKANSPEALNSTNRDAAGATYPSVTTKHREVIDNHSYFKEDDCTSIPKYNKRQYSGKLYKSTSEQDTFSSDSDTDDSTVDEKPVIRNHGNTYNAVANDDREEDSAADARQSTPPSPPAQPVVDYAYFKSVSDQFHGSPGIASRLAEHVAQNTYIQNGEDEASKETEDLLDSKKIEDGVQKEKIVVKDKVKNERKKHKSLEESVLIEGVLFRADYLGSTQLISDGRPSKAMRMMQAQEAVGRIKACDNEHQPSTEVDLFISIEKIMILNTDLQEVMMDHALRTISYIADIGETLVIMARRGPVISTDSDGKIHSKQQSKICCHVFQSNEAQLIAQSIGEAFQVAYSEFLRANGIDDPSLQGRHVDYQEVLNQQEIFGDELNLFAGKQKEVIITKPKGESLGVVVVESGWGSMVPTVVLANMAPGGVAARCQHLNVGDQIMSINGVSLVGLPLSSCENYIKATKTQTAVRLSTISCPPVVEVIIKRPDIKYQLGFSVQNGVICSLLRGGIAERGGVRVGHRIIDINNHSVVAVAHEKIVTLLATSIGEIHMKTMPTSIFRLLTGQDIPHYI